MELTPPGKIRCPKCSTIMEKVQAAPNLEVEHCGRCGAMWFDPYELESVLKSGGGVIGEVDYGAARTYDSKIHGADLRECPRDHQVLLQIPDPRQPHVAIDLCKKCGGVLLDAGELKDLSEFTLAERLRVFFKK